MAVDIRLPAELSNSLEDVLDPKVVVIEPGGAHTVK